MTLADAARYGGSAMLEEAAPADPKQKRQLGARALAVLAPRPATGAALARFQLFLSPANTTLTSLRLFRIFDPTNELVASERRDVQPRGECCAVCEQGSLEVRW